jgi:polar amino acid transport system ATP-binding protein
VQPIGLPAENVPPNDQAESWDHASMHLFDGTFGDYLLNKVGKVFPELRRNVL